MAYIIFVFIVKLKEGVIILVSKMIDAVENIENLALERQKMANHEAKKIIQSAEDSSKMFIEQEVNKVRVTSEERINEAKNVAQKTLLNNLKHSDNEIKKLQEAVNLRKKNAIKSIIELVID